MDSSTVGADCGAFVGPVAPFAHSVAGAKGAILGQQKQGSSALGINYENCRQPLDAAALARLQRYELQAVARRLLVGERVGFCLRRRIPGASAVVVYYIPSTQSAAYGQLLVCGSVWMCPVCAAKITERRRVELEHAIGSWVASGGVLALATFTTSHMAADSLSVLCGTFLTAWRWMGKSRRFGDLKTAHGVVHMVRALEVTWGYGNGWHPHLHVLLFLKQNPSPDQLGSDLFAVWRPALERHGLSCDRAHGVDVQVTSGAIADYVAKFGRQPARRAWGAADELAKAHVKRGRGARFTPFDLLRWLADTGEALPGELFTEYAAVFKGRHQLQWSRGARRALGLGVEQPDQVLAEEVEQDGEVLALLSPEEWRVVLRFEQRGQLLEVACTGDAVRVQAFVGQLLSVALKRSYVDYPDGVACERPP